MELKNFFAQDPQGNTIPSPTAYVYQPGTTTLVTGLKDKAGVALSNPFTGTIQGQLQFAAPDGDYDLRVVGAGRDFTIRVRFIDASGVNEALALRPTSTALAAVGGAGAIGADDGAGGGLWSTVAGFIARIMSSAGASVVGFIQAGVGAVMRSIQAKLRETISVKDFGALGDGVTDDAPAIQKAVDYASTFIEGSRVYFPTGKYLLNSTVTVTKGGVVLEGDGPVSTWIINGQANAPAIKFGDGVSMYSRNGLANMVFGQKSGVTAVSGNCGLYVHKCSNFMLKNVQAFQFPASLYDGVIFEAVTQSYMNTIGLQACTNRALYLFNQTFDIYMVNGRCDSSAYGIEFRDCQGIQGANWTAYGNTVNAYRFTTSGSTDNNQFFFLANFIGDTSGQHNWKIEQLSLSTLTNCWAATQLVPVSGGAYDGFYLSGGDVEDISFNGCIAVSNNRHGMNIDYANRIQINGGIFGSNFKPSAFSGLGARNGLSGSGSGILVGAGANRILINGGRYENNKNWGIDVVSGADLVEISGCETRYNIDGSIRNNANGSAAKCRIKDVAGYNPIGYIAAPAVPASGATVTNLSGVDVMVYLAGGTLTGNVEINGHGVLQATNTSYFLPAGETIKLTYSSAPSWQWRGL